MPDLDLDRLRIHPTNIQDRIYWRESQPRRAEEEPIDPKKLKFAKRVLTAIEDSPNGVITITVGQPGGRGPEAHEALASLVLVFEAQGVNDIYMSILRIPGAKKAKLIVGRLSSETE
jgi:hypothetical protein